jgi:hypothetical protein
VVIVVAIKVGEVAWGGFQEGVQKGVQENNEKLNAIKERASGYLVGEGSRSNPPQWK